MDEGNFRNQADARDREQIFTLLNASGYFHPREMAYGMSLFDDHLRRGDASTYQFMMYEQAGELIAYGCYGMIPFTDHRYSLHWLAVSINHYKSGIGQRLEAAICDKICEIGGKKIYAFTSSRQGMERLQAFYQKCGYQPISRVPNYFADGDDQVLYEKNLISG